MLLLKSVYSICASKVGNDLSKITSYEAVSKSSVLTVPMYVLESESKVNPFGNALTERNLASENPLFTILRVIFPLLPTTGVSAFIE